MKAKPNKKLKFITTTPLIKKSPKSKDFSSEKPGFLTTFGSDAETIRKEVMRVKENLKHSPRLFEQMGAIDRPKFKKN